MNFEAYRGISDMLYRSAVQNINEKTILTKFRELYYALKFKKQFRDWLWLRVREPVLLEKYHPKYLAELKEEDNLDLYLENLGWNKGIPQGDLHPFRPLLFF
jgi:hypothetical protein